MSGTPYTNREIDRMFAEIKDYLVRNEETNKKILEGVQKTNGRVSALELWKENFSGKVWTIGVFFSAIWALILVVLKKFI